MSSLVAYGTYLPRHRLQHAELAAALGTATGPGARVVASYDEDSTTMAVEAARRALTRGARPSSIYFATTTPAYTDKTNASAIHAALDLGHDGFAVDMAGSARSAVGALRAAAAGGGLALLSDLRTGRPGSADERTGGDGAAAFLFGDGDGIAELLSQASTTAEFMDRWRVPGELASDTWEDRFGLEQYLPLVRSAISQALETAGVEQPDHTVVSSPHLRTAAAVAKQYQGRVAAQTLATGYAGAADLGVQLAAVLDRAEPGETILLISAADGCDTWLLRTLGGLTASRPAETAAHQLQSGRDLRYATFLSWRGVIHLETPRRPEPDRPASPASARSEEWKFAFVGSRCEVCGRVHVPPTRVCSGCHSLDRMKRAGLSRRAGTVATFTVDRLAYSPSPPMIDVVVDFDGGGRYTLELADADPERVEIGTRVEMTFRRLYTSGGVHNYFWKARPLTDGPTPPDHEES